MWTNERLPLLLGSLWLPKLLYRIQQSWWSLWCGRILNNLLCLHSSSTPRHSWYFSKCLYAIPTTWSKNMFQWIRVTWAINRITSHKSDPSNNCSDDLTNFVIHLTKSLKFKTQTHWWSTSITPPSKMMVERQGFPFEQSAFWRGHLNFLFGVVRLFSCEGRFPLLAPKSASKSPNFWPVISLTNIQILMSKMFWQNSPHYYHYC